VTTQPRAFFALDFGSATTSAAVLGHVGGRWRLIAHTAAPSYFDADAMLFGLLTRVNSADPEMLAQLSHDQGLDIPTLVATWPRLIARTTPQRRIAVLAGSRRQRRRLETAALRAGWLVVGGSADEDDAVVLSRLLLSTETSAVLLGADDSPGGDEKRHLPDLVAIVAAATRSRPELTVVLAGGAATYEDQFANIVDSRSAVETAIEGADSEFRPDQDVPEPEPSADEAPPQTKRLSRKAAAAPESADPDGSQGASSAPHAETPDRAEPAEPVATTGTPSAIPVIIPAAEPNPTVTAPVGSQATPIPLAFHVAEAPSATSHILLAPDAEAGQLPGDALHQVLEGLRALPNDSRLGVARSIASLAYVLDRSIEVAEIGLQGGLIARSDPFGQGHFTVASSHACLAAGSFAPATPSEEVIDGVLAWSTVVLDRHRAMDRLNDLRLVPWGEADGDGAVFRLAAAKAAFGRLIDAMPELAAHAMPELLVAAGGVFSSVPPAVVALALADLVRRPGVSQMTIDQARVLGPLGAIEDEDERRTLLANLADDILIPLGALILPAGIKPGRNAGYLRLKNAGSVSEIELHPGAVQVVDLPPGIGARADLEFRDAVRLGKRGHHFTVDVGGGLSGLLVDLRDIPMRISDRPDSRRAALETWQRGMWPEFDE
jgi:hypothetical protein